MDENLGDLFRHTMGEKHPGKEAANVESDSLLVAMGFRAVNLSEPMFINHVEMGS